MKKSIKNLSITEDVIYIIEGKAQIVTMSIEFHPKVREYYWVDALTETGFNLCDSNYGYYKCAYKIQNVKRSERTIIEDMYDVLQNYINCIHQDAKTIILTKCILTAFISSNTCYVDKLSRFIFSASNIHSKQTGLVVSWHEHDIFKEGNIELEARRNRDGQLQFFANESTLYDLNKLKRLQNTEAFQTSKYAFMCYDEVNRLIRTLSLEVV